MDRRRRPGRSLRQRAARGAGSRQAHRLVRDESQPSQRGSDNACQAWHSTSISSRGVIVGERTSSVGVDERLADQNAEGPTLASTWEAVAGGRMTDELLSWPPDVFALTNVVLDRSEAFRFALSPVGAWPPARFSDWASAVEEAGRQWGAWVEGGGRQSPSC